MGKHSLEKKKGKSKKILVVILLLIMICAIIILLLNSNLFKDEETIIKEEAINIVDKTFSNLKKSNVEEVKKYMNYELLISSLDESILSNNEKDKTSNIEEKLFDTMKWSIEGVNIRKDENKIEAEVMVEVTNKDFREAISRWIEKLIEVKKEKNISIEEGLKILEDTLSKDNVTEKTVKKKILLEKQDDWSIIVNEDLRDLLFPEIENVIDEINIK